MRVFYEIWKNAREWGRGSRSVGPGSAGYPPDHGTAKFSASPMSGTCT